MKVLSILIISVLVITWLSCKSETTEPEAVETDSTTTLEGYVYFMNQDNSPTPLEGALITAQNIHAQALTDTSGAYLIPIELTEETIDISLNASKVGFLSSDVSVFVQKGKQNFVPDFTLSASINDTTGGINDTTGTMSGDGAHIEISGTHPTHLYVTQSGLRETALIQFNVTDSQGRLLDYDHRVLVNFSILNGPNGGEYLSPDTMTTINGSIYTVLNSGTIAGPIQLEASFTVNGNIIKTVPIRMAIHGGLPDEDHFSITVDRVNIAGRVHFGLIDNVTAFVGDKYSNPVAPGTAVYFSTDFGIVEGAAITDDMGRASVRYMSAAPLPPFPAISSLATITGWTYGDTVGFHSINKTTPVLLSDITNAIWVDSTSFSYTELNVPKQFNYRINDIWNHPLVEDTQIKVVASGGSLYGDISITTNDTRSTGPGTTDFQFVWAPGDSLEDPVVFISISADPPSDGNGYQSVSFSGNRNW